MKLKTRILKEMVWNKEDKDKWNMWREIANQYLHLDNEFEYERFSKLYNKYRKTHK